MSSKPDPSDPAQVSPDFDAMLEHLVDPVLAIDERGVVLHVNPAATKLFGWTREELLGQKVNVLMGEPYRTEHDGYLAHYLATGETRAIGRVRKVLGRHRSGREFPAELSVSFVRTAAGLRFYGIVRDITEREQMVARLAQVERLAAMGELAAGIAHEVNNPVNTIINCAQLIKDGDDDPARLDDVIQEGMRIATIVRDLLDFARDRSGDYEDIDVEQQVRRVLSLVERRIERQGIRLDAELDTSLPTVSGLGHQIQQVLLNLILNARDALVESTAAPDRPKHILVSATCSDGQVLLRVRDNGPGVAAEDRERIFEPFFSRRRVQEGTGLGLAVSRGIVEAHGGSITLRSEVGAFAEFEIALPVPEDTATHDSR